jgi:ParB family chromosome partitioning protein
MKSGDYLLFDCPVDLIYADENWNCRDPFTDQSVMELAQQIRENTLQHPIQVQPVSEVLYNIPEPFQYRLIAGFRRLAAVKLLKWPTIPAFIRKGLSEEEARRVNFTENVERQELTMMEQARGLARLYPKGTPIEMICKQLNKSRGWVKARLALLEMPEQIKEQVQQGQLTQYDVEKLSRMPVEAQVDALVKLKELKEVHARPGKKVSLRLAEARRKRSKTEMINKAVDLCARLGGEGPWSYALAWAAGTISDEELDSAIDSWNG